MTPGEVKRAIGNPQSIEGGFPNSSEEIIEEMPEQVGQLDNSTWFYAYKVIRIYVEARNKMAHDILTAGMFCKSTAG
jgi:hypothetical protein